MIPPTSCSHQISISCRVEMAMMMSNVPAKTRKKLKTAASARNVLPGWMNATMPEATKTKASTAFSSFHQPADMKICAISAAPAKSATKPNRIEIEDTEV